MADAFSDLRPASFRGIAFQAKRSSRRFGRRVDHRERPFSEQGTAVDLGAMDGEITLEAYVLGPDAAAQRDRLERALNTKGPGLLVHPWRGNLRVQVMTVEATEDAETIGAADFRVTFLQAEPPRQVQPRIDTSRNLAAASDTAKAASAQRFLDALTGADQAAAASWVNPDDVGGEVTTDNAATLATKVTDVVGAGVRIARQAQGQVGSVGGFVDEARTIISTIDTLVGTPQSLVSRLESYFNQLTGLLSFNGDGHATVRAAAVAPTDASHQVQSFESYVDEALAAGQAQAVAATETGSGPLVTSNDAVAVRDQLTADATRVAENASDAGANDVAGAYQQLAGAAYADVTERLGQLPKLKPVQPVSTTSLRALVYAESGTLDRYPETLAANGLPHPAFVPVGKKTVVVEDG